MDNLLHIYAQEAWHENAYIIGRIEALKALRDAIDVAITGNKSATAQVFVNDGEGYNVVICPFDGDDIKLAIPYTDEIASEKRDVFLRPDTVYFRLTEEKGD